MSIVKRKWSGTGDRNSEGRPTMLWSLSFSFIFLYCNINLKFSCYLNLWVLEEEVFGWNDGRRFMKSILINILTVKVVAEIVFSSWYAFGNKSDLNMDKRMLDALVMGAYRGARNIYDFIRRGCNNKNCRNVLKKINN